MNERRKVTIAVAYINLVLKKEANNELVAKFLKSKNDVALERISEYLKQNYSTEEMIAVAEKYSGEPVY